MEQQIQVFCGDEVRTISSSHDRPQGNAFTKAKQYSEKILKLGWFIHEMTTMTFFDNESESYQNQLMVVYRRKG